MRMPDGTVRQFGKAPLLTAAERGERFGRSAALLRFARGEHLFRVLSERLALAILESLAARPRLRGELEADLAGTEVYGDLARLRDVGLVAAAPGLDGAFALTDDGRKVWEAVNAIL